MTLIIGVVCPDGIIIGSDSQTTMGTELKRINRQNPKVIELKNGCIVFAGAGHVSVLQEIEEKLNLALQSFPHDYGLESITEQIDQVIFGIMQKQITKHNNMFGNLNNMPSGDFVFGSCKKGTPLLCHFGIDGSSEKVYDYIAVGSGMPYAEVLLKDAYRPNLSLEDSKYLVYSVIRDTEDVDNYVGGEIHIKMIDNNGEIKTIKEGEIAALKTSYTTRKDIRRRLDQNWSKVEPALMKALNEEEIKALSKDSLLNIETNKKPVAYIDNDDGVGLR